MGGTVDGWPYYDSAYCVLGCEADLDGTLPGGGGMVGMGRLGVTIGGDLSCGEGCRWE